MYFCDVQDTRNLNFFATEYRKAVRSVFSVKRIASFIGSRYWNRYTDRRNCEIHEDGMIVISNPIGDALPAKPAKQTGPDVV